MPFRGDAHADHMQTQQLMGHKELEHLWMHRGSRKEACTEWDGHGWGLLMASMLLRLTLGGGEGGGGGQMRLQVPYFTSLLCSRALRTALDYHTSAVLGLHFPGQGGCEHRGCSLAARKQPLDGKALSEPSSGTVRIKSPSDSEKLP